MAGTTTRRVLVYEFSAFILEARRLSALFVLDGNFFGKSSLRRFGC